MVSAQVVYNYKSHYLIVHVCNRAKCNSNISMSLAELNSQQIMEAHREIQVARFLMERGLVSTLG